MKAVPAHIGLIPDGNRRWAKEQSFDTLEGHREGMQNFLRFCEWCKEAGVEQVTAFGFSTENWKRTEREVAYFLNLLEGFFRRWADRASGEIPEGVRVRVVGDTERFPPSLRDAIKQAEEGTKDRTGLIVNLALSYGGKWDIVQAVRELARSGADPEAITEEDVERALPSRDLPPMDLLIRVGGEKRISNFFLWQAAYAELAFAPMYWPAFSKEAFEELLDEYARRKRRFGT